MSAESEVLNCKYSSFLENKKNNFNKKNILNILSNKDMDDAYKIISKWEDYCPTPLINLKKLLYNNQIQQLIFFFSL